MINIPFKSVQSKLFLHFFWQTHRWISERKEGSYFVSHFILGSEVNPQYDLSFRITKGFVSTTVRHRGLCLPADTYNYLPVISSTIICFMFTRKSGVQTRLWRQLGISRISWSNEVSFYWQMNVEKCTHCLFITLHRTDNDTINIHYQALYLLLYSVFSVDLNEVGFL